MPYTQSVLVPCDAPGLTLSAQLVDTAGANVGAAVTSGFVDLGGGNYMWTYAAFPDAFRGGVVFTAAGIVKASLVVNPEEGEYVDAKTSSRADGAQYTTGRAAKLDQLDAAVSSRADAAQWTTARAAKIDNLDVVLSTRASAAALATAQGVADAVKAVTDRITFAGAGPNDIVTRLSATGVTNVWDTLSSALTTSGSIGKRLVDSLDVAVSTRASSDAFSDLVVNVSTIVDPLTHPVPQGYPAGSAGDALGKLMDLFRVTPIVLDRDAVTVVRGQDYTGADVLQFTNLQWPDLTGAVVELRAQLGTHFLNKTATVIAPRLISVAISEVETAALEPGVYVGDLHASLADATSRSLQRIVLDASYATP